MLVRIDILLGQRSDEFVIFLECDRRDLPVSCVYPVSLTEWTSVGKVAENKRV